MWTFLLVTQAKDLHIQLYKELGFDDIVRLNSRILIKASFSVINSDGMKGERSNHTIIQLIIIELSIYLLKMHKH